MSSGSETLANVLLPALIAGKDFTFPELDLSQPIFAQPGTTGPIHGEISKIEVSDFTDGTVGGEGAFDKIMMSLKAHLKEEYAANRISGAEYSKVYIGLVSAAMSTAAQLLLNRDQSYWQALLVQQQARVADQQVAAQQQADGGQNQNGRIHQGAPEQGSLASTGLDRRGQAAFAEPAGR